MFAANKGIARSALYPCHLIVAEDTVTVQQVVIVETVTAQSVGCPCPSTVVHMTI